MAKTPAERKRQQRARDAARDERLGIVNETFPMSTGFRLVCSELQAAHGFDDWREMTETVFRNLLAAGDGAAKFFDVTCHEIEISENVTRKIERFNQKQALLPQE